MALFKKIEFAEECGVSRAHISVAIKRGKLIVGDDGKIDSEDPINKLYKEHCKENAAKGGETSKPAEVKEKAPKKIKESIVPRPKADKAMMQRVNQKFDIEIREKEAKIAKIDRDTRLMEMREMKLRGQLIPTDLVYNTIRQLSQSLIVGFNNGIGALVTDMAKITKMDRAQVADLRKKVKNILNQSIDASVTDAQRNVDNIIKEHSQRKNMAA